MKRGREGLKEERREEERPVCTYTVGDDLRMIE
jgi:hypothetical protein